ncbi:aminoglycoside phosphotransferase family protein [Brachybacterium sp. FME24]|uniref:aminoglycoside phosphotransferase family protein n=1 Tax=Brachybacterium sp. FME24 TaxID=2742605 RepID=UPI001866F759|nr:aminoglycoside phosphotransferase family protein [Brachybacterium sp. FME24]
MTTPWTPGADWEALGGGDGAATAGVWRARLDDGAWIVKRIRRGDPSCEPHSFRWWRREIAVAASSVTATFEGLIAPESHVHEDTEGASLWTRDIASHRIPAPVVAAALGRFATVQIEDPGWFVVGRLRDRVALAGASDAPHFAIEGVCSGLRQRAEATWSQRDDALTLLDEMPHVLSHGDALPRNLLRHDEGLVTAIDWDQLGYAPIGADLATFSMWVDEPVETLLASYLDGAGALDLDPRQLRDSIALTISLIAISRALRTAGCERFAGYGNRFVAAGPQMARALQVLGVSRA